MTMGDVGFLPSIRRATLREACGVRARTPGGARTNKEQAISFRAIFTTIPLLPNFFCGVIFVLDLPSGEERQNIKAA
jgi:hypothetical protein